MSSTAPDGAGAAHLVELIHPFHPRRGEVFELVVRRRNWGEDRVYVHDQNGVLLSFLSTWTDIDPPDVFVAVADGRCPFRLADLVALAELIDAVRLVTGGSGDGVSSR